MPVEIPVQPALETASPPPEPVDYESRYGGIGATTDPEGDLPAQDAAVGLPAPEVTSTTTTTSDFESRYANIGMVPGTEATAAELDGAAPTPQPLPDFAARYADIGPTPAAAKALDETPIPEPPIIRAPTLADQPALLLAKIGRFSDSMMAPGAVSEPLVSKEVAGVGVRLAGGGARLVSKLLEKVTGKPYVAAEAGVEEALTQAASDFTQPEGIASLLSFAVPGVAESYAVGVLSKLPEQYGRIKEAIETHGLISPQTAKAATEAGIQDLFGFLAAKSVTARKGISQATKVTAGSEPRIGGGENLTPAELDFGNAGSVKASMLSAAKNPEVFNPIVQSIPIDVMDVLSGGKIPAEKLRHDQAMFANLLSSSEEITIDRSGLGAFLRDRVATLGTKPSPLIGGRPLENSTTNRTDMGDHGVVSGTPTEPGLTDPILANLRTETPPGGEPIRSQENLPASETSDFSHTTEHTIPSEAKQGGESKELSQNLPRARELPTLRPGEKQGDLLSTQTEDLALVGEKGIDHGARQTAKEKAAQAAEEARLKQESEQQLLEERYAIEADTGDELLTAIAKGGGLPAKSSKYRKFFAGELDRVDEAVRNPMSKKQEVSPNAIFRKNAPDLDDLTTILRGKGFDFETPNDLLNAVENRMFTNRPHYPKPPASVGEETFGFGPGAAAAEEALPKSEPRAFAERFQADESIVQSLRDATGNRFYEPISNKVTVENATAIVRERGIPESINMLKDETNGIDFEVRSVMGQFVVKRLNEAIRKLEESAPKDAEMLQNVAGDLAEWQQEYGTRLGRGVQSFAIWSVLTPEGKVLKLKRDIQKVRDKFTQENGEQVKPIVEAAVDTAGEAKGEAGKGKAASKEAKESEDKIEKLVTREQDRIARQLSDTPTWKKAAAKKQNEILALIRAHLKKEQEGFVGKMLDFGVEDKLTNSIDRIALENRRRIEVISKAKERSRRGAQFDNAADRIADQLSDTPTFREGKGKIDPARELIRKHLKSPQTDFVKRLVDYGADKPTAETIDRLAIENRERILKVDRAKRAEALRQQFSGNKVAKKLRKPEWEKIVELADHGLLNDKSFMDAASEKLGLPKFTSENRAEVLRLAHEIDAAPEGMPRDKATLELSKYIANLKGFDAKDVPLGIYYGNMLSGVQTQAVNFLDTLLNVSSEITGAAITNPKAAMRIYGGLLRGFAEGRTDALLALTEGRMVTDGKWLDVPKLMEVARFGEKGGVPIRITGTGSRLIKAASESKVAYPLRGWKYVSRLMAASDAVMFRGAKEARMALLADRLARGEGLHGKALSDRVHEILGMDEKATQSFTEQAKSEGFTGSKAKARIAELREMSRPKEASADAADFASEATYNHAPHGTLGFLANEAGKLTETLPIGKVVIPFTRIVANVTNRGANYTPWGFKHAFYGYGFGKLREATPVGDARTAMIMRATMGTAALTTLLALQQSGAIDINGQGPSDNERRKQLQNAGWKPYSIKVGDHYFSYIYTPFGLGLSVLGNMSDSYRYNELSQKDGITRAGYAISRIGSTIFNQSFLSGTSVLFRALSGSPGDTISSVKQLFSSTVGSFTTPSIVRDIYRWFDPKVYQTTSIVGDLLKNTPFAAAVNKPALNAFGESVSYPSNRFISVVKDDAAWRFIVEKGLRVPVPDKYSQVSDGDGGKRRITPDEYYRYLQNSGQQIKAVVLDKRFEWATLDHDEAQKELSAESERIRDQVKRELFE